MATRYEVYNKRTGKVYKVLRTSSKAMDYMEENFLIPMAIRRAPQSDFDAIDCRPIEVPDIHFVCGGCGKDIFADVDLNEVGATVKCPYCHHSYYAKECLYDARLKALYQSVDSRPNTQQTSREVNKVRMLERNQWNSMSFSEKQQARRDMEITGNYWGPEHEGFEHWL